MIFMRSTFQELQFALVTEERQVVRIDQRIGKPHDFEHLPLPQTSHSIIYAGYGSATPNVLGGKVELLLQTTSLVYQAIYEIKWFFYMIMNKLYYVVGLVLLLLFALSRENRRYF